MGTPVCLANAVADALGVADIRLPMTRSRVAALIDTDGEPPPPAAGLARPARGRGLTRAGSMRFPAPPPAVWDLLLDPPPPARLLPRLHRAAASRVPRD